MNFIDIDDVEASAFREADAIFFLTNDLRVGYSTAALSSKGCYVFNGSYLAGERKKSFVQQQARFAGVAVPKLASGLNFRNLKNEKIISELNFPLYIKSEGHAQDTHKVGNSVDLERVVAGLNLKNDWYAEEAVDAPGRRLEKVYWVAGACFGHDAQRAPSNDIIETMDVIGRKFAFDVFSADFIVGEDRFWCIDVNPAPGFFGSKAARKSLVRIMQSRLAPA